MGNAISVDLSEGLDKQGNHNGESIVSFYQGIRIHMHHGYTRKMERKERGNVVPFDPLACFGELIIRTLVEKASRQVFATCLVRK